MYRTPSTSARQPGLNLSDPNAKSAHFDGTGFVEVAHATDFEMLQFTVEALVAPDSVGSDCLIVGNMSPAGGWALTIVLPSPGDDPDIDGYFAPVVSDGSGSSRSSSGGIRPRKARQRLARGDDVRRQVFTLYWDGVERVSSTWPAVGTWPYAPNTQEPLQIGLDFKGAIQEVAVYDKALTADEIGNHFLANTSPGSVS